VVACPRGATPSRSSRSRAEGLRPHRDPLLRLIGLFKLVKGVILLAAGVGAVYLSRDGAMDTFSLWIGGLPLHPGNRWIVQPLATLLAVNPRTLRAVGLGTFVYAAIFTTEGVGLLLGRHWAEYMAVVATASFLPLEVYEATQRPGASRVLIIVLNLAIVLYLLVRLRAESRRAAG
jgi:uncharacterized membrane protein (DUF2068 family)